jgi:hypothetical protein
LEGPRGSRQVRTKTIFVAFNSSLMAVSEFSRCGGNVRPAGAFFRPRGHTETRLRQANNVIRNGPSWIEAYRVTSNLKFLVSSRRSSLFSPPRPTLSGRSVESQRRGRRLRSCANKIKLLSRTPEVSYTLQASSGLSRGIILIRIASRD